VAWEGRETHTYARNGACLYISSRGLETVVTLEPTTLSIRRSIGYARAHVFLFVVQRETLSAKQQRDYLALLSSWGGELRERYQIRKEGVRTPTVAHLSSPALRSSRRD